VSAKYHALTIAAKSGLLPAIQSACHVCPGFDPRTTPQHLHPPFKDFVGIWDTGASMTAIDQRVIDACGLIPTGVAMNNTANGLFQTETYLVNLKVPNGVAFPSVVVTRADLGDKVDVLIGMDIMTHGDLALTNVGGMTVFTFRVPSMLRVDFVQEANEEARALAGQPSTAIGRNDACPCGSGKKYKKCHMVGA
jgi:uncharacterized protein YchJ